jgi:hypothetical protein
MCEELDKCYGTDGTFVRTSYMPESGARKQIPEYRSYNLAKRRCTNVNDNSNAHYSKLGIEFRFTSFTEWWNELGRKPTPKHSVDRIDGDGHYEVGNVRWASLQEQSRNRSCVRRVLLTYPDGTTAEFECLRDAAVTASIVHQSIHVLCHGRKEVIKGYRASFIN